MKKLILSLLSLSVISFCLKAQLSATGVLSKSESFYTNIESYAFTWTENFKSAINQDTNTRTYSCYYQRKGKQKALKMVFSDGSYALYDNDYGYFVYPTKKEYYSKHTKANKSDERLTYIPVWDSKFFFDDLPRRITNIHTSREITTTPDQPGYEIKINDVNRYYFLKLDSAFHIFNFKEVLLSNYGIQVKDYIFKDFDTAYQTSLLENLAFVKQNYTDITNAQKDNKSYSELLVGKTVSVDTLCSLSGISKPYPKFFCFDFFYKTCYPCIKAIPELNRITQNSDIKTLKIVGVDPVEQDTGRWEIFKQRYPISYPIVDGKRAISVFEKFFGDQSIPYPTQVIVSSDGKVLAVVEGYAKNRLINSLKKLNIPVP